MPKFKFIYTSFFILILACQEKVDYYHVPTYSNSGVLNAVIEIPAGSNKKFEYNAETQNFEIDQKNGVDRVINFLPYLGNYGFIPSTLSDSSKGGDGDALDVLVLSESTKMGSVIEIIPIGVLKLIDKGELDYKIIAIPLEERLRIINTNSYLKFSEDYLEVKQIIELWFLSYNKEDAAAIEGWGDEKEAEKQIELNRRIK